MGDKTYNEMPMVEASCTECGESIGMTSSNALMLRARSARLCAGCYDRRKDAGVDTNPIPPVLGLGCVRMQVELRWALTSEDLRYRAVGDMEEDFVRRSVFRMRDTLSLVAGHGHDVTPIGHYTLGDATRCHGRSIDSQPPGWMRQYHDALNALARHVSEIVNDEHFRNDPHFEDVKRSMCEDVRQAFVALAIGNRQGWFVDSQIRQAVAERECGSMPMSEDEAGRRMGLR